MDSLSFQMYALEHGIDLDKNIDDDVASTFLPADISERTPVGASKSRTEQRSAKAKETERWADSETDSDDEDEDEDDNRMIAKGKDQDNVNDDDNDDDDDDDEVGGLEKAVNWLGHSDSDDDFSDDSDECGEDEISASKTKHVSKSTASSNSTDVASPIDRTRAGREPKAKERSSKSECRVTDLLPFFKSPKLQVRCAVATQVAGLSTTVEGRSLINSPVIMQHLCRLLGGDDKEAKPALQALINMCELRLFKMNLTRMGIVKRLISSVLDRSQRGLLDLQCMLLANVTQTSAGAKDLMEMGGGATADDACSGLALKKLIDVLVQYYPPSATRVTNATAQNPIYLAHLLINVTQLAEGRAFFLGTEQRRETLVRLLPYMNSSNAVLRQGAIGLLKNICHEIKHLPWLLGKNVDALGRTLTLLSSGKEKDESVWILAIDLIAVVLSTEIGRRALRENPDASGNGALAAKLLTAQKLDVASSLPRRARDQIAQLVLIAEGKTENVRVSRDIKPGDVVRI